VLDDDEVAEEEDGFFSDLFDSVLEKEDTWFTVEKMRRIKEVHDYLDSLPEVGKVLSLASFVRMGEQMNDGKEFDDLVLTLIYKRIPDDLKAKLIEPYLSIEHDEVRISLRIFDSMPDLRRKELIEKIRYDLVHKLGFEEDKATLTGMLVLYNNMLQSLYQSQIQTLGVVMLGIGLMLLVLFRSLSLALVGLIPNILAAVMIPGFMGWAAIPLDMMTITIAAITIGIAVDNGIHYIYRFREEYARCGDYLQAMEVCHANIGRAVFYTSITIVFGFSILALSNFIPTILFGVLTAMAMCIALLAALTLLPKLILLWKPFPAK
jgi:predicted RND superfamily exporter protein